MARTGSAGFSLIELIIAISIISILTVVAVPAYQQYVLRANRATVKALLVKIAQDQEAWFGDRKTYALNFQVLYGAQSAATRYVGNDGQMQDNASASTIYEISMASANTSGTDNIASCSVSAAVTKYAYVLIAKPSATGMQNKDTTCMTLCLSNTGIRGASGTGGAATCWQR
jgi:type IV pilus assembly protein PilE